MITRSQATPQITRKWSPISWLFTAKVVIACMVTDINDRFTTNALGHRVIATKTSLCFHFALHRKSNFLHNGVSIMTTSDTVTTTNATANRSFPLWAIVVTCHMNDYYVSKFSIPVSAEMEV